MDPTATLQRIQDAIDDGDQHDARDACRDLASWLGMGGFEPPWRDLPEATRQFRRWRAGCGN